MLHLPAAEGPASIHFSEVDAAALECRGGGAAVNAGGVDPRCLERFVRYLHRRMCLRRRLPAPEDYVHFCTTTGNAYRHLDTVTAELGRSARAALAAAIARPGAAAAEETLLMALRAFVLEMAVGKEETFGRWRAWAAREHATAQTHEVKEEPAAASSGAASSGEEAPFLHPMTDEELESFREYILLRDPQGGAGDPAVPKKVAFFTKNCARAAAAAPQALPAHWCGNGRRCCAPESAS